jgi:ABC-type dipeptide/oligopeptide/nickel transport system ATPase subunit
MVFQDPTAALNPQTMVVAESCGCWITEQDRM